MSGEVASRFRSTVAVDGLLRVMSAAAADRLGLGAVRAGRRRGPGAGASQAGVGRCGLGVAGGQHERRREALPVDCVVGLEAHQQLTTRRYHFRWNLQNSHNHNKHHHHHHYHHVRLLKVVICNQT